MFRAFYRVPIILLMAALFAIGQTSPSATDQTQTSKTGSITGRVVDERGQSLPNARVHVYPVGGVRTIYSSTDREGIFKLTDLEPVSYRVSVSMPAYISASDEPGSDPTKQYKIGDSATFVLIKGGVITGAVTNLTGDPVRGITVSARMIRNRNGRKVTSSTMKRESPTDDRGIYRIYGLPTGTYIVMAGGSHEYIFIGGLGAFDPYLPTYAPSSTRDTADEISVRAGEEVSNVDIGFRGEMGRTISGTASGPGTQGGVSFNLTTVAPAGSQSNISIFTQPGNLHFAFHGVADGDYYLTAHVSSPGGERAVSEPKLIRLRGADIEDVDLTVRPLGSVSGRVVLEESRAIECKGKQPPAFKEMFITSWHKDSEAARNQPQFIWSLGVPVNPDSQGNFTIRNLAPSPYFFAARFPVRSWYLKAISLMPSGTTGAGTGPARKAVDVTRVWTNVKTGERLSGLVVTLAQGAALFQGQVVVREGETRPERMLIYLVPAEREAADELLRFYGTEVGAEGKIGLYNLAPGRYWLLAQPANDNAQSRFIKMRSPEEAEFRAQLRREAEAAKTEIELKPCQSLVDFRLTY